MFGRKKDDPALQWDPQLGSVLERVSALAMPDLAAEVMAMGFSGDRNLADPIDVDGITWGFSRPPQATMRDSTIRAQKKAALEAEDPNSDRYKWLQLRNIIGEGVAALEKALLINQTSEFSGVATDIGYLPTRAGVAALQENTVASIVAGDAP